MSRRNVHAVLSCFAAILRVFRPVRTRGRWATLTGTTPDDLETELLTTAREGWLRLPKNDRFQHFFRDGVSECGRYVTDCTQFEDTDGPVADACPSCVVGAAKAKR